jgi:hypothetical protein
VSPLLSMPTAAQVLTLPVLPELFHLLSPDAQVLGDQSHSPVGSVNFSGLLRTYAYRFQL